MASKRKLGGVPLVLEGASQGLGVVRQGLEGRLQEQVGEPLEPENGLQLME